MFLYRCKSIHCEYLFKTEEISLLTKCPNCGGSAKLEEKNHSKVKATKTKKKK